MNDTERLDWLESMGDGCALIHDDNNHWAVGFNGMQNVIMGDGPGDLRTQFVVEKDKFRPTVREAIDAAIEIEEQAP